MHHRIVSLLPSATELVVAAGAGEYLVGRSHECDFPPSLVANVPILTRATANPTFTSSREVHNATCTALIAGSGLYALDTQLLAELKPTLIITQDLCAVCAVDIKIVESAIQELNPKPQVLTLNPFTLADVLTDIGRIRQALGLTGGGTEGGGSSEAGAPRTEVALRARVEKACSLAKDLGPPKLRNVAFLEWTDPLFFGGHWTPGLVEMAGGQHPLNPPDPVSGAAGPSFTQEPQALVASDPDVIIIGPCGLDLATARVEAAQLAKQPWWQSLKAVQSGDVFLVDGNQHFNRPGPRLVDALEFLVGLLHERWELIPQGFPFELLTLQPEQVAKPSPSNGLSSSTSNAGNEQAHGAAKLQQNGHAAPGSGPEEEEEEQEEEEEGGCHCAPSLPPDVEDAYSAAVAAGRTQYTDPVSGYQAFTEAALRTRGTCCGNKCRHCPFGHFRVTRRLPRINRITAPTFCRWGNSCAAATSLSVPVTLLVACPEDASHLGDRLTQLTQSQTCSTCVTGGAPPSEVVVLVACDPTSRAVWSANDHEGGSSGGTTQAGKDAPVDPFGAIQDVCLKAQISMVVVPVGAAQARRVHARSHGDQGGSLHAHVLQRAKGVLEQQGKQAGALAFVAGGSGLPGMPWLEGSAQAGTVSWGDVARTAGLVAWPN